MTLYYIKLGALCASRKIWAVNVRLGPKADIDARPIDIRFTPKADIVQHGGNVRFVPKADILRCGRERRYSITSSAVICTIMGTSRPSAFAVLRLMISSNLAG